MKKIALILTLMLVPSQANAAPFGIREGQRIETLKTLRKIGKKTYVVLPKEKNNNFDLYGVVATPVHGVCAVFGQTRAFATWSEAKTKRDEIANLLAKYGKPRTVKPNMNDIEALAQRPPAESYDLAWEGKSAAPMSSVSLEVRSAASGLLVQINYFYKNFSQCEKWVPDQDYNGL